MATSVIKLCLAALLTAAVGAAALPAWAADADACLDNRDVQALIAGHKIKTWPAVKAMAGISEQYKEVSAVRVCELNGAPYYVVNVAGPAGESRQLVLNAVTGTN
jgi:hypothetical protein